MYTVKAISDKSGVTPDAIRHYVRVGLLKPSRDALNGYKYFNPEDVQRIRFIRQAKALGFSLHEIGDIFANSERKRSPCPHVREIIQQKIEENHIKIKELQQLQERMVIALEQWNAMPDGIPDGHSICHLIESMEQ